MTMNPKDLARLIEVLDAAFQAEQARMGEIGRRIDQMTARLRDLTAAPAQPGDDIAPATRVGADMRWRAWAEDRRKRLNAELAGLMREREERRAALGVAFGKLQAAQSMRSRLLEDAARKARRP